MNARALVTVLALLAAVGVAVAAWRLGPDADPATEATAPPPAAAGARPNVIILMWDTVRSDRLGPYGYGLPTTPALDRFAQGATVFTRAVSPAIWTPPSHASLFTGLAPKQHGVDATYKWLDHHHATLAEILGEAGFDTYAFSSNPYVSGKTNLLQGFQTTDYSFEKPWKKDARAATEAKLIPEDRSSDISPGWTPIPGQGRGGETHAFKDAGPVIQRAFTEWLGARPEPERPFFAYLNYMEAHIPRVPSLESRKLMMNDAQLQVALQTDVSQINLLSYIFGKLEYTPEQLEAINRTYDASVRDLDAAVGGLLDDLEARGVLDDTIVIVMADHGENLGDHHMFGHKYSMWDTLLSVPLLIRYPKALDPGRRDVPVSTLDVFATVLDLVGLPARDGVTSQSLRSRGAAHTLFSDMIAATPTAIKRVDSTHGLEDEAKWLRTFKAAELDGWKYIRGSDASCQLYHLPEDPKETRSLCDTHPDRVAALGRDLDAWLSQIPAYNPDNRRPDDQAKPLSRETRQMLRSLGYVDGDGADEAEAGAEAPEAPGELGEP